MLATNSLLCVIILLQVHLPPDVMNIAIQHPLGFCGTRRHCVPPQQGSAAAPLAPRLPAMKSMTIVNSDETIIVHQAQQQEAYTQQTCTYIMSTQVFCVYRYRKAGMKACTRVLPRSNMEIQA